MKNSKSYDEVMSMLETLRKLPRTPVRVCEIYVLETIARNNVADMLSVEEQVDLLDTMMYCFRKDEPMGEAARSVYEMLFTGNF